jgi:putative redox protein
VLGCPWSTDLRTLTLLHIPEQTDTATAAVPYLGAPMAVEISGEYTGGLKMELTHGPSAVRLATAAPADNQGDGSSFSPTDLLAASLGACMVTTMAIVARRDGIHFGTAGFRLEKHMQSDPRRVAAVPIRVRMPPGLSSGQRARLEHAARTCPVARSLDPAIEQAVTFTYPDG